MASMAIIIAKTITPGLGSSCTCKETTADRFEDALNHIASARITYNTLIDKKPKLPPRVEISEILPF